MFYEKKQTTSYHYHSNLQTLHDVKDIAYYWSNFRYRRGLSL